MAIHDRDFDDERCKNCSVNAKCYACDIFLHPNNEKNDVSVNPYDMKYIRCGKGENDEVGKVCLERRITMSNGSILEKFLEEITNEVPTDDRIVLNTSKIEIGTKKCIPDRFVRKEIILSWVEPKGENNE